MGVRLCLTPLCEHAPPTPHLSTKEDKNFFFLQITRVLPLSSPLFASTLHYRHSPSPLPSPPFVIVFTRSRSSARCRHHLPPPPLSDAPPPLPPPPSFRRKCDLQGGEVWCERDRDNRKEGTRRERNFERFTTIFFLFLY